MKNLDFWLKAVIDCPACFIATCVAAASVLAVVPAVSEPLGGTLIGTSDGDILSYECVTESVGRLDCSFVQVLLSNQAEPYLEADLISEVDSALVEFQTELLPFCETEMKAFLDVVLDDGYTPQNDDERDLAAMVGADPEGYMAFARAIESLCTSPTRENIR